MHPKQTEGSDVRVGTSLDQMYAKRFGQDTPIPSMQLCIENVDQAGGCAYGYACVYTDSISWASPNEPLPVIRDPRVAFEKLFGVGGSTADRTERRRSRRASSICLRRDVVAQDGARSRGQASPRSLPHRHREVERRIQMVEQRNMSGGSASSPRRRPACLIRSRSRSRRRCSTSRRWPSRPTSRAFLLQDEPRRHEPDRTRRAAPTRASIPLASRRRREGRQGLPAAEQVPRRHAALPCWTS